ncbi:MAG: TonB-dependent receptor [Gemmatimonadaceae bacterium]|nr:TonB-dependent receptor [Gemmatimonadaceae bacterium]
MNGSKHRRDRLSRARALLLALALGAATTTAAPAQGTYDSPLPTSPARIGTVGGIVRAPNGQPLAEVEVRLERTARATGSYLDTTDVEGKYSFASVPSGSWVLTFERASLATRRVNVSVQDRAAIVDVTLTGASAGAEELEPVIVTARNAAPAPKAIGSLPDVRGTEIFAGKKTEAVQLDSLTMNTSQDVSRQLFSRIPGANITETANSGFPSNGIGFRGLNPVQSVEMNVRQDGVNIVADLYGYPETYYTPPAESLEQMDLVRGSSSLQFGPQFGGVIDYVLRDGTPDSAITIKARETGGSFGMFNSYLSAEGGRGKWTYFAYGQYRHQNGWRPNSDVSQVSAAGKLSYHANEKLTLGISYSLLRNQIHMPGGLDNVDFNEDARSSFRARNWLASPWNIVALNGAFDFSANTKLTSTLSFMASQRYLIWRNEDGGPAARDVTDPGTGEFAPREVEWEYFTNVTSETRLLHDYSAFGMSHTIATGIRLFGGELHRQEGGPGSTGSDFNLNLAGGPYETDMKFGNFNGAVFAENELRVSPRLTVTPGARVEFLHSTARGYTADTIAEPRSKNRTFVLVGAGAAFRATTTTDIYANATQAYRPIEYSFLTPFASLTRVDPNLKDPKGYNLDLGWRGSIGDVLEFDVGVFDLVYNDRIGLIFGVDSSGTPFTERTNVATSKHRGVESYLNLSLTSLLNAAPTFGTVDVWDALGYTHARYTDGEFNGNTVEFAPSVVNRAGVNYGRGRGSVGMQWSYVSNQFTDANNTVASLNADIGIVPAYNLIDLSARWQLTRTIGLDFGVNNVANQYYFTMRTTEYPGPGIIPGIGRSIYLGARAGF